MQYQLPMIWNYFGYRTSDTSSKIMVLMVTLVELEQSEDMTQTQFTTMRY